jgi:hypothetical protein
LGVPIVPENVFFGFDVVNDVGTIINSGRCILKKWAFLFPIGQVGGTVALVEIASPETGGIAISRSIPIKYAIELADATIMGVYDLPLGIGAGTKVGNGDRFFGPNKKRKEQYESQETDFHTDED